MAPETKLEPVTVRVKADPPAVAELGAVEVRVGTGLFPAVTVKVFPAEVPPPGAGLKTVTVGLPAVAISDARIAAESWVEEMTVVVRSTPFHRTLDPETKLVPVTVRVKAGPPATADAGESVEMAGVGLLTVKVLAPEVPPPGVGLKIVTLGVPPVAISVAGIAAVSWVAET